MPDPSRIVVRVVTTLSMCVLVGAAIYLQAAEPGFTLADKWGALPSGQEWGEVTGVAVDAKNTIIATYVRR
jgi:hypothetical protein